MYMDWMRNHNTKTRIEGTTHAINKPGSNRRYTDRCYLVYRTAYQLYLTQVRLAKEWASYLQSLPLFPGLNAAMNVPCNGLQNLPSLGVFQSFSLTAYMGIKALIACLLPEPDRQALFSRLWALLEH